jgi:hypothetical protein
MENKNIVFGKTNLGLILILEPRLQEVLNSYQALETSKTWGEFRELVSARMYEAFVTRSGHYDEKEGQPAENTPFTPNDVFDVNSPDFIFHPEIEMSTWVPADIQETFGKQTSYYAMDGNVPGGNILVLDEERMEDIIAALESQGYSCNRNDEQVSTVFGPDFNPDDYPEAPDF